MILLSLIYCCLLLRSFTKADTPITRKNVPNVGSAIQLGELYDATRDVLLIKNLYSRETIENSSTDLESKSAIYSMAIRVVEFSNRGYKIRKVFALESTYSKEIIEF